MALGVGLLAALTGMAVVWVAVPAKYQAEARLHVATQIPESELAFHNFVKTQSAAVPSEPVLRQAFADRLELLTTAEVRAHAGTVDEAVAWLHRALTTDTQLSPELLRVSLSGDRPDELAAVVNAVADAYLRDFARREEERARERLDQLQAIRRDVVQKLHAKRQEQPKQTDPLAAETLRDEIASLEAVLNKAGVEQSSLTAGPPSSGRVTLRQPATPPTHRVAYGQWKFLGATGGGLFLLGVLGVVLVEGRRQRVYGADDVSGGLGIPVIDVIPALPDNPTRAEAADTLRALLMRTLMRSKTKVVLVASAAGGEGRTTLACLLAASLARAGKRMVLLDGDLRRPAVHRLFDLPLEPGFSEFLRAEMELDDIVLPTPVQGLWVIPAGRGDAAATRALSHETVAGCVDYLRQNNDFVIVDVPPVLPVADALLIGQHADAAVLAVRRDVSRLPAVHQAHQRLTTLGLRVLGAVVLGARQSG